jgi:hypothetical protein
VKTERAAAAAGNTGAAEGTAEAEDSNVASPEAGSTEPVEAEPTSGVSEQEAAESSAPASGTEEHSESAAVAPATIVAECPAAVDAQPTESPLFGNDPAPAAGEEYYEEEFEDTESPVPARADTVQVEPVTAQGAGAGFSGSEDCGKLVAPAIADANEFIRGEERAAAAAAMVDAEQDVRIVYSAEDSNEGLTTEMAAEAAADSPLAQAEQAAGKLGDAPSALSEVSPDCDATDEPLAHNGELGASPQQEVTPEGAVDASSITVPVAEEAGEVADGAPELLEATAPVLGETLLEERATLDDGGTAGAELEDGYEDAFEFEQSVPQAAPGNDRAVAEEPVVQDSGLEVLSQEDNYVMMTAAVVSAAEAEATVNADEEGAAEADAAAGAEEEARLAAEAEATAKTEEARLAAEEEARLAAEAEAAAKAEEEEAGAAAKAEAAAKEARLAAEADAEAIAKAEEEARLAAEAEATAKTEEARLAAEAEATAKTEEARLAAEEEARLAAEAEAIAKSEEARLVAEEEEARLAAEAEAIAKTEVARLAAEAEATPKAEEEARLAAEADAEAIAKAEVEARLAAEAEAAEAIAKTEDAILAAEAEAVANAEEEARLAAEAEAAAKAAQEAKLAEAEAIAKAEEARLAAEAEAAAKAEEEARLAAEAEAAEAIAKTEEQARLAAEAEAAAKGAEEARLAAEAEVIAKAEEEARLAAEAEAAAKAAQEVELVAEAAASAEEQEKSAVEVNAQVDTAAVSVAVADVAPGGDSVSELPVDLTGAGSTRTKKSATRQSGDSDFDVDFSEFGSLKESFDPDTLPSDTELAALALSCESPAAARGDNTSPINDAPTGVRMEPLSVPNKAAEEAAAVETPITAVDSAAQLAPVSAKSTGAAADDEDVFDVDF